MDPDQASQDQRSNDQVEKDDIDGETPQIEGASD